MSLQEKLKAYQKSALVQRKHQLDEEAREKRRASSSSFKARHVRVREEPEDLAVYRDEHEDDLVWLRGSQSEQWKQRVFIRKVKDGVDERMNLWAESVQESKRHLQRDLNVLREQQAAQKRKQSASRAKSIASKDVNEQENVNSVNKTPFQHDLDQQLKCRDWPFANLKSRACPRKDLFDRPLMFQSQMVVPTSNCLQTKLSSAALFKSRDQLIDYRLYRPKASTKSRKGKKGKKGKKGTKGKSKKVGMGSKGKKAGGKKIKQKAGGKPKKK